MAVGDEIAGDQLRTFIERIETLEEEKAAIAGNISDVYTEAKLAGFDARIIRQLVRLRKMDNDERAEQEALLELYREAVGMDR